MLVKLPRMTKSEMWNIIEGQTLCRIAFKGDGHPYIAPFQYIVVNRSLYFHFTDYGRKMRLLEEDCRVCVEIESYRPDLSSYCFVVLRGSLELVTGKEERKRAITKMSQEARRRLSPNFLVAHGFSPDNGWSAFSPDKPMKIVKLRDVVEEIGLKFP